jgi:hypothetical protein
LVTGFDPFGALDADDRAELGLASKTQAGRLTERTAPDAESERAFAMVLMVA